ncbi:hypothetical protein HYN56_10035 [Flavobacterium crocinum]|uniref:Uncharacterized protein n=1 Tax=Flavobacterium crocinum TaxID=2183896 RepID=A0A2S1YKD7_9FLAO|nr:hypothetical protein [Flavobacterium crocinum]AWK04549.1 hypothetical protein HYN56_10035 [Flavobacterium crocinum]
MKFIFKNKINEVDSFSTDDSGELTYIKENVLYAKDQNAIYDAKIEISGLKSSGDWICFNHTLENPKGFVGNSNNNFEILDKQIIKELKDSFIYYGDRFSTTKLQLGNSFAKVWTVEERLIFFTVSNGFLIYTKDDLNINFYSDGLDLRLLWQYDLKTKYNWKQRADYKDEPPVEKQAKVIKFLGVYSNELWVVLNNGALLAVNIETGEESRFIKEGKMIVGESEFEDFKGYFGYETVLDEKNGFIFNLSSHFYIEYNLVAANKHFDSYSFKESSETHKLSLNYIGGFDAENIYSYEGSDNNRFAVFNKLKKEIIWSEEIEEVKGKFPAIRDMKYGGEKIYILDHNNALHVFEK